MIRYLLMLGAMLMSMAGCATMDMPGGSAPPTGTPESFAHRAASSEVLLRWTCRQPEPGLLRVEGVAQNFGQAQPVGYLQFDLVGVDAQGRTTAETSGAVTAIQLRTNESTPFQLDLKTTGAEARFDLYYHYRFQDEFDTSSILLAGPPMVPSHLMAQTRAFMIRDVCGANQHLPR